MLFIIVEDVSPSWICQVLRLIVCRKWQRHIDFADVTCKRYSNNTNCFWEQAPWVPMYIVEAISHSTKSYSYTYMDTISNISFTSQDPTPPPTCKATWVKMSHDIVDVVKLLQNYDNNLIIVKIWKFNQTCVCLATKVKIITLVLRVTKSDEWEIQCLGLQQRLDK